MRALVVVNPAATAITSRSREVLAGALGRELKLDVVETTARGHAAQLAAAARRDRLDAVVVLGGDGTVNEVVNGLLGDAAQAAAGPPSVHAPAAELPRLAVVPAGSTNVFARALGYSPNAVEATAELLDRLAGGSEREIGLGIADDRWFTFCAGLGLDADTVRRVEARRAEGSRSTPALYVRSAVRQFYLQRAHRKEPMTLHRAGAPATPVHLGLVCNTRPWTYLGGRPVVPCPDADFTSGLDLFALTRLRTVTTLRMLAQILAEDPRPHGSRLVCLHDQAAFRIDAPSPRPFQVDGDDIGDRTSVTFTAVPRALRVIA